MRLQKRRFHYGKYSWVCFLTGLIAIITPCVFPLIPVTVSFFFKTQQNKTRRVAQCNVVFTFYHTHLHSPHADPHTYFW